MDFTTLAKKRYSVRKFSDRPVEKEKLDLILKAAQLAPTACNNQPQRILIIESDDALKKLKTCTQCHFDAPLALLVCYDAEKSWKRSFDGDDSGTVDASIVTTQMMLQAAEIGLGTTWVAFFDPKAIRERFRLPARFVPVTLLPLGYPAEDSVPNSLHDKRDEMEKTVFYNSF